MAGAETQAGETPTAPPPRPALLETRRLAKSFGGLRVLDDLDFRIEEGAVRCLIGPNGSGKSTLLKTIAGLHQPDRGDVYFAGKRINGLRPFAIVRRGIAMKFQIVGVFRELTVYQNIRVSAQRLFPDEEARTARIDDLLDLIGLDRQRDLPAGILSHGEQQWLEIGMAIGAAPRLLLLDEPTAGMTPEETRRTADIVQRLNLERGTAIIIVEHDMNFVRYLARPVSVLHQGRIFFEGDIDAVGRNADVARIYFGGRR